MPPLPTGLLGDAFAGRRVRGQLPPDLVAVVMVAPDGHETDTDQMVEEILQLRWRLPALAGESIELTPTHPGGAVGGQGECGQSQSGGQGGREGQRDGAQRPLGGADARGASGILMEDGGIEQLRLDGGVSASGAVQPAGVLQFEPQFYAAVQPHAAQEAVGQADCPWWSARSAHCRASSRAAGEEKRGSAAAR